VAFLIIGKCCFLYLIYKIKSKKINILSEMSDEELENYIIEIVPWKNNSKGVNLTSELQNAQGYSEIVLQVDVMCNVAEFSEYHYFAETPEKCEVVKVFYNNKEMTKEDFYETFK
jgi:hypothetical protein